MAKDCLTVFGLAQLTYRVQKRGTCGEGYGAVVLPSASKPSTCTDHPGATATFADPCSFFDIHRRQTPMEDTIVLTRFWQKAGAFRIEAEVAHVRREPHPSP